jgi:deoxyadenosine kinase
MASTQDKPISMNYTRTFSDSNLFIGISGIIGAGKSTITTKLAERLRFDPCYEPVKENPYLPLFYKDMEKYGSMMQIFLLNKRFKAHQQAVWGSTPVVQDRTIYEDVIFAKMLHESGNISDLDFETYRELFINMTHFLHRPDVIVYLDVEPEKALERVHMRGRECEKDLPLSYLKDLRIGYEDWIADISSKIPVIRVDWNEFKDVDYIIDKINICLQSQRKNIISV